MRKRNRIKRFNERSFDTVDESKLNYEGPLMLYRYDPYYRANVVIAKFDTRDSGAADLLEQYGYDLDSVKKLYGLIGSKGMGGGSLNKGGDVSLLPDHLWSDERGIIWGMGYGDMTCIPSTIQEKIDEFERSKKARRRS